MRDYKPLFGISYDVNWEDFPRTALKEKYPDNITQALRNYFHLLHITGYEKARKSIFDDANDDAKPFWNFYQSLREMDQGLCTQIDVYADKIAIQIGGT